MTWVAALGIGLLTGAAFSAGSGCEARHESPRFSQPAIVKLPQARGVETYPGLPQATAAPRSNEVGDPSGISGDSIEAMPIEDPYAG